MTAPLSVTPKSAPLALAWGRGINRASGVMGPPPDGEGDLRNIFFGDTSIRLRGGLGSAVATISGVDDLCHLTVFAAEAKTVAITYNQTTRAVKVYLGDLLGTNWSALGTWGTLAAGADAPPQFSTAETYGILVLAHDEPNVANRLQTYRYDPADMTPLEGIVANLDNTSDQPVKFRGVYQYLGYLWGWGFGTNGDPDRPEILRVSSADDPTRYDANWYIKVGARSEPIVAVGAVRSALAVLKAGSWHRIDGTTRDDWGPVLVDNAIGCVSGRAAWTVDGTLWWWSPTGPRATDGTKTIDPGLSLDMTGPLPADLPAFGPLTRAFALYYPEERHLGFYFPDNGSVTTVGVKVSLRQDDEGVRWCYDVLGVPVHHACAVNPDAQAIVVTPGYASAVATSGSSGSGVAQITVSWTENTVVGDETVECWYQPTAGSWTKVKEVAESTLTPGWANLTITHAALVDGTYTAAVRYRRGGRYLTGYDSADPADWPAGSRATGTIVAIGTPASVFPLYNPALGGLSVTWTMADATSEIDLRLVAYWDTESDSNPTGLGPVAWTTAPKALAAGTLNWSGTSFGGTVTPTDPAFLWLPWGPGPVGAQEPLVSARAEGLRLIAQVRGRRGTIVGAWATTPDADNTYVGYNEKPVFGLTLSQASVTLGTVLSVGWGTAQTYRAGATTIRELCKSRALALPPNTGGYEIGNENAAAWEAVLDETSQVVNPLLVAVPAGATCQKIGQWVEVATPFVGREQITAGGMTHWSRTQYLVAGSLLSECTF